MTAFPALPSIAGQWKSVTCTSDKPPYNSLMLGGYILKLILILKYAVSENLSPH